MTVLSIIAAAILVLGCLYLVISPYLRADSLRLTDKGMEEDEQNERNALLSTLNEIELDFKMKKISEADYKKLANHYESMLVTQMKRLEESTAGLETTIHKNILQDIEDEIEQELAQHRKAKGGLTR
jgi:hypothetical protein